VFEKGGKASSKKKKASRATQRTDNNKEHLLAAADGGPVPIRTRLRSGEVVAVVGVEASPRFTTREVTMYGAAVAATVK
jgi:hypothetical protein